MVLMKAGDYSINPNYLDNIPSSDPQDNFPYIRSESPTKIIHNIVKSNEGMKFDDGKPRLASIFKWIDIPWLIGIMEVLEFGAIKYERNNWKKGFEPERVLNGVFRHCTQFLNGESYDSESGKHHLLHAACGLMFAYFHAKRLEVK